MTQAEQFEWIKAYMRTVPPWAKVKRGNPSTTGVLVDGGVVDPSKTHVSQFTPAVVRVYGSNTGIGSTHEGIGPVGGVFASPLSTGSRVEVVSTSASDTAAGTGMRTIRVVFEKTDGTIASEDLTLNGTGAVASTATDIVYIYPQLMHGLTYGGAGLAVGNVDVRLHGGGAVIERILAGRRGIVTSARTRVPPGFTGFIFSWSFGVSGTNSASFDLCHDWDSRTHAHLDSMVSRHSVDVLTSGWIAEDLPNPMAVPEGTELEVTGIRLGGSDAAGACLIELMLVRNS